MWRRFAMLFCGLLLGGAVAAAGLKPGDAAPEFSLKDLAGKPHTLAELRARGPVLLFFWSVECGFCRVMSPKLQRLYADLAGTGLIVAGLDLDFNNRAEVEAYVQERKLEFLILHSLDNADVVNAYGVPGTPTLVLVGRDGRIVYYGHSLAEAERHLR